MAQTDRRKAVRFLPRKSTFVALRPEFVRLGKVVDISSSGLRFQYLIAEGNQVEKGRVALDMFIGSDGYYLPDIPCETVYERKLEQHGADAMGLDWIIVLCNSIVSRYHTPGLGSNLFG